MKITEWQKWILAIGLLIPFSTSLLGQMKHESFQNVPFGVSSYGYSLKGLTESSVESVGVWLVNDYSTQLRISPSEMKRKRIYTDGVWWMAKFEQAISGVPIDGSEISYVIGSAGNIIHLKSTTYDSVVCPTVPTITNSGALHMAQSDLGGIEFNVTENPTLVILPTKIKGLTIYRYDLAWRMRIDRKDNRSPVFTYYVDAMNGRILLKGNLIHY